MALNTVVEKGCKVLACCVKQSFLYILQKKVENAKLSILSLRVFLLVSNDEVLLQFYFDVGKKSNQAGK